MDIGLDSASWVSIIDDGSYILCFHSMYVFFVFGRFGRVRVLFGVS